MTIIGIDPDVGRNGVGVVNKIDAKRYTIELHSLTLPELIDWLKAKPNIKVYVEASWLIGTHSWHVHHKMGVRKAHAMGINVGQNQQVGKTIVEFCKHNDIDVEAITPLRKMWKGRDGKITAWEFEGLTNYKKRSNQEERDAGLISLVYSGIPLRLKVK